MPVSYHTKAYSMCILWSHGWDQFLTFVEILSASGAIFTTFIFPTTYKWAHKARLLHYTRLERLAGEKHLVLFGPFISNTGNEVLWIQILMTRLLVLTETSRGSPDRTDSSNLPIKEKNYNNESFYKMYRRNSGKMTGEFSIEKCLGDFVFFYRAQCHKTFITCLSSKLECFLWQHLQPSPIFVFYIGSAVHSWHIWHSKSWVTNIFS